MGLTAPSLGDVRGAQRRIAEATNTPLLRFEDPAVPAELFLKLENLQPIGSFKLRGALNAMRSLPRRELEDGVYTASAGNMAQGVAWAARALGVPARVIVPDGAPRAKLDAIERLGGQIFPLPFAEWWNTMRDGGRAGMRGKFVHPFADPLVMAGNGTIGLEILAAVPDVDVILVPWGGGGLACGIAAAARALNSSVRVIACEVEGAAPLKSSLAAGKPGTIQNRRTFVDGIGGPYVFPDMWPLVRDLITDALTADVDEVADMVRFLAQRARVVAEGAGATALAVARRHVSHITPPARRVACVVSGGNIDARKLAAILSGSTP